MLKDVKWSEDGTYSPHGEHTPIEFFNNALKNSFLFDIELGYFNSAAINVLSHSFATFISKGGMMRMAINQIVSKKDKDAIEMGLSDEAVEEKFDLQDFEELCSTLDEYGEHFFRCLSYLIQERRIEIRIIRPKDTNGISHSKIGQFSDGDTIVGFNGSANFTLGGLLNNRETIEIYLSTSPDPAIQKRIVNRKTKFVELMAGKSKDVVYLDTKDLEEAIHNKYGKIEVEELIDVERKLKEYKTKDKEDDNGVAETFVGVDAEPCFPYGKPRDYQVEALRNWVQNKQRGLFAMATGTGKTLTSLNCLLQIYKTYKYYKAVILVPTITLVDQWEEECRKFHFKNIIKICSKNKSWKQDLDAVKFKEAFNPTGKKQSFIIISTYASFARENVFLDLMDFPAKSLHDILLIADECHNMGSGKILNRLNGIKYTRRIGLSATPERQFDEAGNEAIRDFFGCKDGIYSFEFGMQEAIDKGYLCRYYYYPHIVRLEADEMNEYIEISKQLTKFFNFEKESFTGSCDALTMLLLKRKRIIHKARNKEQAFKNIIEERYSHKGNLRYTLVYVPEGNQPDTYDADKYDSKDTLDDDKDATHIIDTYTKIVRNVSPVTTVKEFMSGIKNRNEVLQDFADGKLEVLTSMKCLDEGVDVPRSELAIFCASTGNPRQFIQRRGRILRMHKDKYRAYIHDLVVCPYVAYDDSCYKMEQSLLKSELRRVRDFAMMSENADYAFSELEDVLTYYKLPLF